LNAFIIATVTIHDAEGFEKYVEAFAALFGSYKGEVLVADGAPLLLEGSWPATRTVIIRFDSEAEALRWYHSDEYQAAIKLRIGASTVDMILAKALA